MINLGDPCKRTLTWQFCRQHVVNETSVSFKPNFGELRNNSDWREACPVTQIRLLLCWSTQQTEDRVVSYRHAQYSANIFKSTFNISHDMDEIFVLKLVISGVWVWFLFYKVMTEMYPAIACNTVTSFVNTCFFLPLFFLIFYRLSQLLTRIFSLIASLVEIYPPFQAFVQLMYFHALWGKSNVLMFKLFFNIMIVLFTNLMHKFFILIHVSYSSWYMY